MKKHGLKTTGKDRESMHVAGQLPVAYELELHRAIELEAYLCAEKDSFRCSPLDYWLTAEKNVHRYF